MGKRAFWFGNDGGAELSELNSVLASGQTVLHFGVTAGGVLVITDGIEQCQQCGTKTVVAEHSEPAVVANEPDKTGVSKAFAFVYDTGNPESCSRKLEISPFYCLGGSMYCDSRPDAAGALVQRMYYRAIVMNEFAAEVVRRAPALLTFDKPLSLEVLQRRVRSIMDAAHYVG